MAENSKRVSHSRRETRGASHAGQWHQMRNRSSKFCDAAQLLVDPLPAVEAGSGLLCLI